MLNKLENPIRIKELNPSGTLKRLGLKEGDTFCDIGAGSGIFTFAAAEQTGKNIYAVEISEELSEVLQLKKKEKQAGQVQVMRNVKEVPSASCKQVLLCTVLHELENIPEMLEEIKRILEPEGTLAIIEFHKRQTPFGPPEHSRISPEQVERTVDGYGFRKKEYFELGENFYGFLADVH